METNDTFPKLSNDCNRSTTEKEIKTRTSLMITVASVFFHRWAELGERVCPTLGSSIGSTMVLKIRSTLSKSIGRTLEGNGWTNQCNDNTG